MEFIKPIIQIDVVSDVVCPWCYIGKRRLEKAMQQLSDRFTFEVSYQPFELNPSIPHTGVDQRTYLVEKFGGDERYETITSHTTGVASEEELAFNFEKQRRMPNTRKAHAIIMASRSSGKQTAATEAFFKAYFTDGIDLSNDDNLVSVAVQAGLEATEVRTWISDPSLTSTVASTEARMQELGISGVPFYIINNKYGVSGAQPSGKFVSVFEDIGVEMDAGQSCDIDQKC